MLKETQVELIFTLSVLSERRTPNKAERHKPCSLQDQPCFSLSDVELYQASAMFPDVEVQQKSHPARALHWYTEASPFCRERQKPSTSPRRREPVLEQHQHSQHRSFRAGEQSEPAWGYFAFATPRQQRPLAAPLATQGTRFPAAKGKRGLASACFPRYCGWLKRGEQQRTQLSPPATILQGKKERASFDGLVGKDTTRHRFLSLLKYLSTAQPSRSTHFLTHTEVSSQHEN